MAWRIHCCTAGMPSRFLRIQQSPSSRRSRCAADDDQRHLQHQHGVLHAGGDAADESLVARHQRAGIALDEDLARAVWVNRLGTTRESAQVTNSASGSWPCCNCSKASRCEGKISSWNLLTPLVSFVNASWLRTLLSIVFWCSVPGHPEYILLDARWPHGRREECRGSCVSSSSEAEDSPCAAAGAKAQL